MPQSPDRPQDRSATLRYILWTSTALITVAAFIVATPYVFLAVGRIRSDDWAQFSNEGQAYGGVAAVIGMLAIGGVVASLILQVRESKASHVQMDRTFHADLLNRSFDDPELVECWGMPYGDTTQLKQVGYVNMIVSTWFAMFEIGRRTEADLHRMAAAIFLGMPAREYWPDARSTWIDPPSRKNLRFVAIMDEEYGRAVARGPVARWPSQKALAPKADGELMMISGLAIGSLCGAAIAAAAAAILRSRPR
jgi:Family of unknown function (DUF6082)